MDKMVAQPKHQSNDLIESRDPLHQSKTLPPSSFNLLDKQLEKPQPAGFSSISSCQLLLRLNIFRLN